MDSLAGLNAQVLGISIDHTPCLQAWAEHIGGIHYPLLSDFWPHGAVAHTYGVLRAGDGFSERAIFVLDKEGIIRYIDIHAIDDQPDIEEVFVALRQINDAEASAAEESAWAALSIASAAGSTRNPAGGYRSVKEIVMYCARWCKDCRKAKAWLDERGVKYVEVDVDLDIPARNQVRKWANGFLVTPVIEIDGTIILDFDVPKLEAALRKRSGS